ncbi:hypothetical protein GWI33_003291 [Rhynchophorus ferrugineus]|uniref:Uncharacterized protein n=1 Tax=Rhynchophorus ferrugineus TaxID=354439 RepID=A0A834IJG0_RHYFE|nr:hypothetical protein GWI33_003291 [Rhynchophorus ferrugineus]
MESPHAIVTVTVPSSGGRSRKWARAEKERMRKRKIRKGKGRSSSVSICHGDKEELTDYRHDNRGGTLGLTRGATLISPVASRYLFHVLYARVKILKREPRELDVFNSNP